MIKTGDTIEFTWNSPHTGPTPTIGIVRGTIQDVLITEVNPSEDVMVLRQDAKLFDPYNSAVIDHHMKYLQAWCTEIANDFGDEVSETDILGDTLPNYCAGELTPGRCGDIVKGELYRRHGRDLPWS